MRVLGEFAQLADRREGQADALQGRQHLVGPVPADQRPDLRKEPEPRGDAVAVGLELRIGMPVRPVERAAKVHSLPGAHDADEDLRAVGHL